MAADAACARVAMGAAVRLTAGSAAGPSGEIGSAVMAGGEDCAVNKVRATGEMIGSDEDGVSEVEKAADVAANGCVDGDDEVAVLSMADEDPVEKVEVVAVAAVDVAVRVCVLLL
jgi:hypothetical protein